jgi:hypothetical protein
MEFWLGSLALGAITAWVFVGRNKDKRKSNH